MSEQQKPEQLVDELIVERLRKEAGVYEGLDGSLIVYGILEVGRTLMVTRPKPFLRSAMERGL